MKPVAIVGGGITGLSAAYTLHKQGVPFTVFEASARLGGALFTERVADAIIEHGADSWVSYEPAAAQLAKELGIGDRLILSNDAERATYIVRGGRLVPLPKGMRLFVPADLEAAMASPLFSAEAKQRIRQELNLAPRAQDGDVSIAEFAERHFGKEVLASVAEPLLAGVYGGDASRLSAQAVLPQMLEAERRHGSLIRAMQNAPVEGSIFTSLRGGMGSLVDALLRALPKENLQVASPVRSIRVGDRWNVNDQEFSALLLTTPAYVSARLLQTVDRELSELLREFTYTDALSVTFLYDHGALGTIPTGFGFLVPRDEQRGVIACTFVHQKWPEKVPAHKAVLRVFMISGSERDDSAIAKIARSELQALLGITATPEKALVHRWPQAMPQYTIGHMEKMKRVMVLCRETGISVAGNAYRGIGVSHCVRQGQEAAERIIAQIRP
jgi:oxygen-dependent protoporphyrinogen oxidase